MKGGVVCVEQEGAAPKPKRERGGYLVLAVVDEVGGLRGARKGRSQAVRSPQTWPEVELKWASYCSGEGGPCCGGVPELLLRNNVGGKGLEPRAGCSNLAGNAAPVLGEDSE